MSKYLYFSEREFNNLTPSCSLAAMSESFMTKLDKARSIAGIPFVLNCAYRSKEWDISKGRSGRSYHCSGRAVDIRCKDSESRWKIIHACTQVGLSVGLYGRFLHVDNRPIQLIFFGESKTD